MFAHGYLYYFVSNKMIQNKEKRNATVDRKKRLIERKTRLIERKKRLREGVQADFDFHVFRLIR